LKKCRFGRKHTKEKVNFYYIARGSLAETKSHLLYGKQVGYFDEKKLEDNLKIIKEIWKELNYLGAALRGKPRP